MSFFQVKPLPHPLRGEIFLPADKSITHRAIILSAICQGKTAIENFALNGDCLATINAFRRLGVRIETNQSRLIIYGKGLRGLHKPAHSLAIGESGTTMRLLLGVLAGQNFQATLVAAKSLSRRPMLRVIKPLRMMGAVIRAKIKIKKSILRLCSGLMVSEVEPSKIEEYPPITIKGGSLKPITYKIPIASAQVKSAILLAGLYCCGITKVIESIKTRDHTERMLKLFKADIKIKGKAISINGAQELTSPLFIDIPGDISSAIFFVVAATILAGSSLIIKSVGLNPSRLGAIRVLKRMGAKIKIQSRTLSKVRDKIQNYEPVGDLIVKSSLLKGTTVKREEIPSLIDEIPILMIAACDAKGRTLFEGVQELRVKETDRINSMMKNLNRMGANIQVRQKDSKLDLIIIGAKHLVGTKVSSFGDHRTAMSMIIAALKAKGSTTIDDVACISKSFPDFLKVLSSFK